MHALSSIRLTRHLAILIALCGLGLAHAQSGGTDPTEAGDKDSPSARWVLSTSIYTRHFHPSPDHNNHQRLISVERLRDDGWLAGLAHFHNSFDQPSTLAFIGRRWDSTERLPGAYLKVVGGLLHGYKGEYRDKIPFNRAGIAPVVIPSVGWQIGRGSLEMVLFGNSGVMWTVGYAIR